MSEAETIRTVAEVLGLLGILGSGFFWLAKNLWKAHRLMEENTLETRGLKEQMAQMNGSVREHTIMDDGRFAGISQRLSHIEGNLGLPMGGEEAK